MRGVVEVPLKSANGTEIGKILIDKKGRMKIEMKEWAKPHDVVDAFTFVRDIANLTGYQQFSRKNSAPSPKRWGLFEGTK